MLCAIDGCEKSVFNKGTGLCSMHYYRKLRGSSKKGPAQIHTCSVEGCGRRHKSKGLCQAHYLRQRRGRPMDAPMRNPRAFSEYGGYRWYVRDGGYLSRTDKHEDGRTRTILQHRAVMEEHLGRALESWENVHHINGVRGDNRIENLELWVTKQPKGQRPEDLVRWAFEVLDKYIDEVDL